jgi:hypothetical protein
MANDINNKELNRFRAADAFEFVDAVHRARDLTLPEIEGLMEALAERMGPSGCDTLLLAAYRGYEHVWCSKNGLGIIEIVKLNDSL